MHQENSGHYEDVGKYKYIELYGFFTAIYQIPRKYSKESIHMRYCKGADEKLKGRPKLKTRRRNAERKQTTRADAKETRRFPKLDPEIK